MTTTRQAQPQTASQVAERDEWIRAVGLLGWQREQNRRRAARIARNRNRRRTS